MDQWTHCRITLPSAFIVILIVLIALMTFQEHSFSLMEIAIQKTPEPKSGMNRSPSSNDSVNSKNNNNRNSVQRKKIHRSIPFCPKDDTRRGKYFYLDLRPSLISKRYCGLNNLDMASLKKNFGKCPLINRRPNCPLKEEGEPLYLRFIGDSRMRQIWHAFFEYLVQFEPPTLDAMAIKSLGDPSEDTLWMGNVDLRHYLNGQPYKPAESMETTKNLANNLHYHLVEDLDYFVVGSLLHDLVPIASIFDEGRRKQEWPGIAARYRTEVAKIVQTWLKRPNLNSKMIWFVQPTSHPDANLACCKNNRMDRELIQRMNEEAIDVISQNNSDNSIIIWSQLRDLVNKNPESHLYDRVHFKPATLCQGVVMLLQAICSDLDGGDLHPFLS